MTNVIPVSDSHMPIPVLSVAGLNMEEPKKTFIKDLMLTCLNKRIAVEINIIPDPTNQFDSNAIKVVINKFDIGFISKNDQVYFDFSQQQQYAAHIVSWGVLKDGSVYVYIQPKLFPVG